MPKEISTHVIKYNQITITCSPDFIQRAAITALEDEKQITDNNRKVWRERCNLVVDELQKAGFKLAKPQAGIYVFAKHPKIKDSGKFAAALLEKEGIAIAPGNSFGEAQFFRICINQENQILIDSIRKMGNVAESLG